MIRTTFVYGRFALFTLQGFVAAVQLTNTVYNDITAGTSYSIGWSNATGPVTLTLKNGGANNLQTVATITSGATSSPFTWSIPTSLPADTYAIEISDGSRTNYSPQFQLLGGAPSSSTLSIPSTSSAPSSSTKPPSASTSSTRQPPSTSSTPPTSSTTSSITSSSTGASSTSSIPTTSSSSDKSTFSSTSLNSSSTPSSPPTSSTLPTTASSSNPVPVTTPAPHTSLSTGSKAAIGIGATFGVFALAALLWLFFYFGKRAAARKAAPVEDHAVGKAELSAEELRRIGRTATELEALERVELEGRGKEGVEIGGGDVKK